MAILTENEQKARSRTCYALDFPSPEKALKAASELFFYVSMFKVGKELHTAACNEGIKIFPIIYEKFSSGDYNIFADLKFHDTPNTVAQAARALAIPGIKMYNLHVSGGEKMCRSAVDATYNECSKKGLKLPYIIGVTELTSISDYDLKEQNLGIGYDDLVRRRTELAIKWNLTGIVCPASKAGALEKEFGSDLLYVTPGIEWAGIFREGQKQLYTPDRAVQDCKNSVIVIGGALTNAGNEYVVIDGKKKLIKEGTKQDRQLTALQILRAMALFV
jgi:orotidine-5'-phosphate decarboxylase